jgi:hypothetical protein
MITITILLSVEEFQFPHNPSAVTKIRMFASWAWFNLFSVLTGLGVGRKIIWGLIPSESRNVILQCHKTVSRAPPAVQKRPRREADNSSPSSAKIKNSLRNTSTPPL